MAGIYLHIPFCKRKCAYCDFYSIAQIKYKHKFVEALCKEIKLRKEFLEDEKIQTIYFGGGTPSILSINQLDEILNSLNKNFKIDKNSEITLEANPDDLSKDYLKDLSSVGVNRLSVGIQSFRDNDLLLMKRKHSVNQAIRSVKDAQDVGFNNISIDLIYGLPNLKIKDWEKNISEALKLKIQHISAYHLTIEPNTLFQKYHHTNKIKLPAEEESLSQFKLLKEKTAENGFLHYEISNFAKDGSLSLHNTNYWRGVKYLGLGPSAHSYNLTARQWNIQKLPAYLAAISQGEIPMEIENLTENEKYNDFIITSLRTMWGLNIEKLKREFGEKYEMYFLKKSKKFIKENNMKNIDKNFKLTEKGKFISDNIMRELLFD